MGTIVSANNAMRSQSSGALEAKYDIQSLQSHLSYDVLRRRNIGGSISRISSNIDSLHGRIQTIVSTIDASVTKYNTAENSLLKKSSQVGSSQARNGQTLITLPVKPPSIPSLKEILKELGIGDTDRLSEEELNLLQTLWKDIKENISDGWVENTVQEFIVKALESSGSLSLNLASLINVATAIAKGPVSSNSFVILNPSVIGGTNRLMQAGGRFGTFINSVGGQYGLAVLGGILDFSLMVKAGESTGTALVKSTSHVIVGSLAGNVGRVIGTCAGSLIPIPVVGPVVGGAVGFATGILISTVSCAVIDAVIDNREKIIEKVTDTVEVVVDATVDFIEESGEKVKDFFYDVGDALSFGWDSLGSIFG